MCASPWFFWSSSILICWKEGGNYEMEAVSEIKSDFAGKDVLNKVINDRYWK